MISSVLRVQNLYFKTLLNGKKKDVTKQHNFTHQLNRKRTNTTQIQKNEENKYQSRYRCDRDQKTIQQIKKTQKLRAVILQRLNKEMHLCLD